MLQEPYKTFTDSNIALLFQMDLVNLGITINKMEIRNPFNDKWGSWRDDISSKEKAFWTFITVVGGMLSGRLIMWIKDLIL